MSSRLRKSLLFGLPAVALSLGFTGSARANPNLPGVQNLDFTDYNGSAPKGSFSAVQPTGWTGGGDLIFIDSTDTPNSAAGPVYLQTYGNPSPNLPGNYVEADGNPQFETSFSQVITGLTIGQTYTLSFYQAGSQQKGFSNGLPTTEQWIVSLATVGLSVCDNCGPVDPTYGQTSTYFSNDPDASIVPSQLMTTPPGGVTPWEFVSVDITADATTDLLSFLAWGDNGSTINLPPIAFLTAVDAPPGLAPEPASLSVLGVGLLGMGGIMRRRRARRTTV